VGKQAKPTLIELISKSSNQHPKKKKAFILSHSITAFHRKTRKNIDMQNG